MLEKNFGTILLRKRDINGNIYFLSSTTPLMEGSVLRLRMFPAKSDTSYDIFFNKPSMFKLYTSPTFVTIFSDNGLLNLATTYSITPDSKYLSGIFWAQVDPLKRECTKEKFIKFNDVQMFNIPEEKLKTKTCIIENERARENGDFLICFEDRTMNLTYVSFIPIETENEFGNISILKIDSSISSTSMLIIPKSQILRGENGAYGSYLSLWSGSKSFFINNDLLENQTGNPGDIKKLRTSLLDESVVIMTETNDSTILLRNIIYGNKNGLLNGLLIPTIQMRLSSTECVTFVKNKKTNISRLIKFYLKD